MSTHPGATTSPSASISRRPDSSTRPTAAMRPPEIATSAVRGGPPDPSTTVPARMTRSCMARYRYRLGVAALGQAVGHGALEVLDGRLAPSRDEVGHPGLTD